MVTNTVSPTNPKSAKISTATGKIRANKQYFLKDDHMAALFKMLSKGNKLKLPEPRCPEEVGKTNTNDPKYPNYCLYHRVVGHPTKNCYIFKDLLQNLVGAEVLRLRENQKRVIANVTSLRFGFGLSPVPTRVVLIPKGELKLVNANPHQKEKGW